MTTDNIDDLRSKFKLGGFEHKAVALLAKHDLGSYELRKLAGSTLSMPEVRARLKAMERNKYLLSVGDDSWSITSVGLNLSVMLGPVSAAQAKRKRINADRISNGNTTERYEGKELGFTCSRPGAYDAYLLPSIMGDKRVWPNGRAEAL